MLSNILLISCCIIKTPYYEGIKCIVLIAVPRPASLPAFRSRFKTGITSLSVAVSAASAMPLGLGFGCGLRFGFGFGFASAQPMTRLSDRIRGRGSGRERGRADIVSHLFTNLRSLIAIMNAFYRPIHNVLRQSKHGENYTNRVISVRHPVKQKQKLRALHSTATDCAILVHSPANYIAQNYNRERELQISTWLKGCDKILPNSSWITNLQS